jgi:hypothetical protein
LTRRKPLGDLSWCNTPIWIKVCRVFPLDAIEERVVHKKIATRSLEGFFLGSLGGEKKACNGRANTVLGVMMILSKFLGIQSRAAYKISMVDVRPLGKPEDRVAGNKRGIR